MSDRQNAVRGPRPETFPHNTLSCTGQFQYDDTDNCYRCITCGEVRPFYDW